MDKFLCFSLVVFLFIGCAKENRITHIASPNGEIDVTFLLDEKGAPSYTVKHLETVLIDTSALGFEFKELPSMKGGFQIIGSEENEINETWSMLWGEQSEVVNHYRELSIQLQEKETPNRLLTIHFRVYDDGLGFRYEFPEQENFSEALISGEHTDFNLTGDHQVWWQPGDWDIYEHLYNETMFSEIDALSKRNDPNLIASYIPENAMNTPVTMKTKDGYYLSFHEANLSNYPGMTLKVNPNNYKMTIELVGSERLGGKAKIEAPFKTPWRTVQISQKPGNLIESKLIVNLNEPNALGDIPYFTPMKYVGIWWEMHIGKSTWDMEGSQDMTTYTEGAESSSKHGATTENAKKYIDFAAANGIQGLLVEGWNTGWDQWINTTDREGVFDFMTPYPDYNFKEVMAYAKKKGVKVIMHHETSAAPRTYEKQMEEAYNFMNEYGISSVKTGYVGKIIPEGEYHHGQWMVNHYEKVLKEAAKKNIAVNAHEPIKATGKRRTYPNAIAREGLRGQEFNAWASDGGNPPNHLTTIAFTRMLAGPIDFTPGVFNIKFDDYKKNNQVNTTLAHQLALYVVVYSPLQMACDLPEHYLQNGKVHPAFQFIRDVAVDWETSKVLDGEIGDYVVIARKDKNSPSWFVGGITNEERREMTLNFDFLPKGKNFKATLYKDAKDAHWDSNPEAYEIQTFEVDHTSTHSILLAEGGGFALSLTPQ